MNRTVSYFVLLLVTCSFARGQSHFEVLYNFGAAPTDGANPNGGLVADSTGNLYGTTQTASQCPPNCGTVFELSPMPDGSWSETTIYAFCSQPECSDGKNPNGNLIIDADGNLYGGTETNVFELTPAPDGSWIETVLSTFTSDFGYTISGLIFDGAGNLYGTAAHGGNHNAGTAFKLSHSGDTWTNALIYTFCLRSDCADGQTPNGGLTLDPKGNLYGATAYGGGHQTGTVFELIPSNGMWTEKVLLDFGGGPAGGYPGGRLLMDPRGNLYGATGVGGSHQNGVAFLLTPNGTEFTYSFLGSHGGGGNGGLAWDVEGNFYGSGGSHTACGLVFRLNRQENVVTETDLHVFNDFDGCGPREPLTVMGNHLYGVAFEGGTYDKGVVFEVSP